MPFYDAMQCLLNTFDCCLFIASFKPCTKILIATKFYSYNYYQFLMKIVSLKCFREMNEMFNCPPNKRFAQVRQFPKSLICIENISSFLSGLLSCHFIRQKLIKLISCLSQGKFHLNVLCKSIGNPYQSHLVL